MAIALRKKGSLNYTLVLIVALVLLFGYVFMEVALKIKAGSTTKEIGQDQKAILRTVYSAEQMLFYIDQSAIFAAQQGFYEMGKGKSASQSHCGKYHGYPLLNCPDQEIEQEYGVESGTSSSFGTVVDAQDQFKISLADVQRTYLKAIGEESITYEYTLTPMDGGMEIYGEPSGPLRLSIISTERGAASAIETSPSAAGTEIPRSKTTQKLMEMYGKTEQEIKENLVSIALPAGNGKTTPISVHKKAKCAFENAAAEIAQCDEAKTYNIYSAGTFAWREKRGSESLSLHSFGIALDINSADNPMCGTNLNGKDTVDPKKLCKKPNDLVTDLPSCVIGAFKRNGFVWGGDWTTVKDTMHFEYQGEPCCGKAYC